MIKEVQSAAALAAGSKAYYGLEPVQNSRNSQMIHKSLTSEGSKRSSTNDQSFQNAKKTRLDSSKASRGNLI